MKIIITGAGGFLGNELLTQLQDYKNIEIYALTSNTTLLKQRYFENENIHIYSNHISVLEEINITSRDVLLNCAFPRNVQLNMADGLDYIKDVLQKAVEEGIGSVINISSQSIYSQRRLRGAKESDPVNLDSVYAVGKYASELLTKTICKNIFYTNVRLASLVGIGFNQRITNKLINQVVDNREIQIIGGQQKFSFMDVRDAASALILLAFSNSNTWQPIYNLGSGESYTFRQLAELIVFTGKKLLDINVKLNVENNDNWKNTELDNTLFCKDFNWKPRYSMQDTLKTLYLDIMEKRGIENEKNYI